VAHYVSYGNNASYAIPPLYKPGFFAVAATDAMNATNATYSFDNPQLYASNLPKYPDNWCNTTQHMTSYDGSVTEYRKGDLQYGNYEMLGAALPVYNTPYVNTSTANAPWYGNTSTANAPWCAMVNYSTTLTNEDAFVPIAVEVKHNDRKAVIRRNRKVRSDTKKVAKVLHTMSTTGSGDHEVFNPNSKDTHTAWMNKLSAKKFRTQKIDRMAFLVKENERLEKENSILMFENSMQILHG
jgi:hypothetical protein